jgi:hypothetical protein
MEALKEEALEEEAYNTTCIRQALMHNTNTCGRLGAWACKAS